MNKIFPIILAGGMGTRLWPLSRKNFPKQFIKLTDELSFFQQAVNRVNSSKFENPIILTSNMYRFIVRDQLTEIGIDPECILIEPQPRNTAPAILAAAFHVEKISPNPLILIMPSDHNIPDAELFCSTIETGRTPADTGRLVTFGVQPDAPETAYGYLEVSEIPHEGHAQVNRFVEKPSAVIAEQMIESQKYLWNTGIFMFSTHAIFSACQKHCPSLYDGVRSSMENTWHDLDFVRISEESWGKLNGMSIDYAVMEKSHNISVVPYHGYWSDLGNWASISRESKSHKRRNKGATLELDCDNVYLHSESQSQVVVGIGLSDIAVIAMSDAVLVTDMNHAQDVKSAVTQLTDRHIEQASKFPRSHRPWGWSETLHLHDQFRINRLCVHPGMSLSLHSHGRRTEHWIVIAGTAKVTVNDKSNDYDIDQSFYVSSGTNHKLENPEDCPLVLIEVQTGTYIGEDDITRDSVSC